MKTMRVLTAMWILMMTAGCTQETKTTVTETGTSSTSTVSATVPEVDTAAAADAAREATHETGTALETAGQELQDESKTDTRQ